VALDEGGAGAVKAHSVEVRPGRIDGTLRAPGSKSETHRAFLLAAQSDVPCRVRFPLRSEDTTATLACMRALGARLHLQDEDIQFLPSPLRVPAEPLDCANSGTTLRLLAATAARLARDVVLTGDASLRARPNDALLHALGTLGVTCISEGGKAPLTVRGPLHAGAVRLPPATSSQFASGLLLALPFVPGESRVALEPPVHSAPYLDVTLAAARHFGLRIEEEPQAGRAFRVPGGQVPRAERVNVAGDWSSAAFPLVAAAITGGTATVTHLEPDSPQGDRAILGLLQRFGADAGQRDGAATVDGGSLAAPGTVDVSATPDLFPILAVLAACSRGTTSFTGGASLRHKESDRIAAVAEGLERMGIAVRERPDGLDVTGGRLRGASVASLGDHRVHMAFAVAGLAAKGTTVVDDPACAAVSFPGFHDAMRKAGAPFTLLQGNRAQVTP
jgi:3-phosphoshikimate 1-carboxyvinyltransferase